mgnify:CR=1 FL=1
MNWKNTSVRYKIALPIVIVGALLLLLSVIQISSLNTVNSSFHRIYNIYTPAALLTLNADRDLYQAQMAERTIVMGSTDSSLFKMQSENIDQVNKRIGALVEMDLDEGTQDLLRRFFVTFNKWRPKSLQLTQDVKNGNIDQATATNISTGELEAAFQEVRELLDVLGEKLGDNSKLLSVKLDETNTSALATITVISLVAILVTLASAIVFPNLIVKPINLVQNALSEMSKGEADLTQRLPEVGQDEVGKLAASFNVFMGGLQKLVKSIDATATQTKQASTIVDNSAADSRDLASKYAHEMNMIATAVTEMGQAIHEVSANTQQVAEAAKDSETDANLVSSQFNQAMGEIESLAGSVNDSSVVIQELSEETNNIVSVLDVIKGIAEQTNLLALNAAIEAARAGEQGRGFAVVADEVRSLASKTQQSTGDINDMLEKLRAGVDKAVNSMVTGKEKADKTVEYASKSEESVSKISQALANISGNIIQIASAIEEQSSVIQNLNVNIENVNMLSQDSSQQSKEIATSAKQLNGFADALAEDVARFRH